MLITVTTSGFPPKLERVASKNIEQLQGAIEGKFILAGAPVIIRRTSNKIETFRLDGRKIATYEVESESIGRNVRRTLAQGKRI